MEARIREVWERIRSAGVDLLTEGIRLVQAAGEQVLQQIADRRLHVPSFVQGVLERLVGRAASAPPEEIEFVCQPAGPDRFACEPADGRAAPAEPSAGGDESAPRVARRTASKRSSARPEAAVPRQPRRRKAKRSVPPSADGIDAS